MPSPHRRVGLVADDLLVGALDAFRLQEPAVKESAGLARKAVFEGVAFGAILRQAPHTPDVDAPRLFEAVRRVLDHVALPAEVKAEVLADLERLEEQGALASRREKQLAALRSQTSALRARTALEITEALEDADSDQLY